MRGSPLLRALLAFCLIGLLGWPLWHLTHATEAAAVAAGEPKAKAAAVTLQLQFTTLPKRFVVRHLEKDLWKEESPQASMDHEFSIDFPKEGVDLVFHIEWSDDAPLAAARVRLTDPVGDVHEKSIWGKGITDEPLTFP